MQSPEKRIQTLCKLGTYLEEIAVQAGQGIFTPETESIFRRSEAENPWFTIASQTEALRAVASWLREDTLQAWIKPYAIPSAGQPKDVAVIMAGNIPLVNFHDFLSVAVAGHRFTGKLS